MIDLVDLAKMGDVCKGVKTKLHEKTGGKMYIDDDDLSESMAIVEAAPHGTKRAVMEVQAELIIYVQNSEVKQGVSFNTLNRHFVEYRKRLKEACKNVER